MYCTLFCVPVLAETYGLEVDLSLATRKHVEGTLDRTVHNATKLVATSKTLQLFENGTGVIQGDLSSCRTYH